MTNFVHALKSEIIPVYNEFIKELEEVEIETDELKKIHEDYIEAINIGKRLPVDCFGI
jgi:hypothetical protein